MSSAYFEGKNLDEAIRKACEELNLSKERLNYDVLSHGPSGIFGLAGARKARIRVNWPDAPESYDTQPPGDRIPAGAAELDPVDSDGLQLHVFPDNPRDLGQAVLQRILDTITSDYEIFAEEAVERIKYNVKSNNAAVIIGKKGQTLEAIKSLVEKIVNKRNNNDDKIRINVDVEGYLETRKINLENLAMKLADKCKRIGKPISLGQLSAYDRRIVHLVLKDDPDVRTKSKGEGYLKKLVILPEKSNVRKHPLQ